VYHKRRLKANILALRLLSHSGRDRMSKVFRTWDYELKVSSSISSLPKKDGFSKETMFYGT